MTTQTALVFLPDGVEAMSLTITLDVLRRGGMAVTLAGLNGRVPHEASKQVKIIPDTSLQEAVDSTHYDIVICPGGLVGCDNLCASQLVGQVLQEQEKRGGMIGGICAGVSALKKHNIGQGKKATCYPTEVDKIQDHFIYQKDERVVIDGDLITSKGAATGFDFGLAIVEIFKGKEVAQSVKAPLMLKY